MAALPTKMFCRRQALPQRVPRLGRLLLQRLLDEHDSRVRDHGQALWSLLMFDGFLARVHAGAAADSTAPSAEPALALG